jgi:hypothetical protein
MPKTSPIIEFNEVESQIIYYCKGHFRPERDNLIEDLKILFGRWLGIGSEHVGPGSFLAVAWSMLEKLSCPQHYRMYDLLQTTLVRYPYSPPGNKDTPLDRFLFFFRDTIGMLPVKDGEKSLVHLEPFDPKAFEKE